MTTTEVPDVQMDLEKNGSSVSQLQAPTDGGEIHRSQTSFHADEKNIYINDQPISKDDFLYAFGGNLRVSPRKITEQIRNYADPVPAGLAAFSCSTISYGLITMHARHVTHPNVLLGAFMTTAGIVELIVGVLCFIVGNTWATATFLMFGGYWTSFSLMLMDVGHTIEAYDDISEYNQAVAFFLLPWAIFSFALWFCTWKSTWAQFFLLFFVWFFVLLLTIAQFTSSAGLSKAGGFFGVMCGVTGFYNMFAGLADKDNAYFHIRPSFMPGAARPDKKDD